MKSRIIHLAKALVILELAYLILFNLALNLSISQSLVNQIKPEKFAVYWDKAWTWYPFRIHAEGVSVNGQSTSQQWQVDLPAASASIAILPLITRTVKIYHVSGERISYFQRPRLKPDKLFAETIEFFPPIRDREINHASVYQKKTHQPWDIHLNDIQATGEHKIWIYQLKGTFEGDLQAKLKFQTQRGPFSLLDGKLDLKVKTLTSNDDLKILQQATIKGKVDILPVVFNENKGLKILPFLQTDLQIDGNVDSLAFLKLYSGNFHDMQIDGLGSLRGRLLFDQGKLLPGTDLAVSASELVVELQSYRAEGNGKVHINVNTNKPEAMNLSIAFENISAYHEHDKRPLFSGEGLLISGVGNPSMSPTLNAKAPVSTLLLSIPVVKVLDLSVYQRYLPDKWQFNLHGGAGELYAKAELQQTSFSADIKLKSAQAEVGIKDYRFHTDLDLGLKIDSPSFSSAAVDISGTYLKLGSSKLTTGTASKSTAVETSLVIDKGILSLQLSELADKDVSFKQLTQALNGQDFQSLLSVADAELEINGRISDISWISLLMKNSHNFSIEGAGAVKIHGVLESGWLAEGTQVEILPENLVLKLLDYVVQGDGLVEIAVVNGGQNPDVELDLEITDGVFKRQDEAQAVIEKVVIKLDALGKNLSYDGPSEELELHFQIPSAKVKDMAVYNQYLPKDSPLQILGGSADLVTDIKLQPTSASGFVKLHAPTIITRLDDQDIEAQLRVDIKLADGVPKNLDFDIAGSSLIIDQVKLIGEEASFNQADWNILFDLSKGRVGWKKPVSILAEANIQMKDTRPIVAMLSNHRKKHGWLEKLLTVQDIRGEAVLKMQQKQIVIPYAFVSSDKIDIGAKGFINDTSREGMFYARYNKLKGLLKIKDGTRNFDVLKVLKTFDEYSPVLQPLKEP